MGEVTHPSALRVVRALRARGVQGPFIEFEASTKTANDAATTLGCEVGAIASSLVFMLDESPVVVLKSGALRVDFDQFAQVAGGSRVRRASAEEVREATGQSIGGVSPVGWAQTLRVFIDVSLQTYEQIWAACGTPHAVFATTYNELRSLTGATPLTLRASN